MSYFNSHDFAEKIDAVSVAASQAALPGRLESALFIARLRAYALAVSLADSPFAWPGGYPRYGILSDCEALCPNCCRTEISSIMNADFHDGWLLVDSTVNYEDGELCCGNCNAQIPAAYAE
jgi:hypothetical protein